MPFPVIVIGASSGGVNALLSVVGDLPRDLSAAVFITLHIGSHRSDLPTLLSRAGFLPATHPVDGEVIYPGRIYVAPPDHHMIVEPGRISLTKGPRENWARPAIDPLFRSAARAYGRGVIGVILTGGLNDGTAGMFEINARGGTTVVQDPRDAVASSMPQSVIDNVPVDHLSTIEQLGSLLTRLVSHQKATAPRGVRPVGDSQENGMTAEFTHNRPVAVTCPDCGGALRRTELGSLTQFSCHIGHVYTAEVMLAAQFLTMERSLETAMRSLHERAELCRQMLGKLPENPETTHARAQWEAAGNEALNQTEPLQRLLTKVWIHPARANTGEHRDT